MAYRWMAFRWWAVDGSTFCASRDVDPMTLGRLKGDTISSVNTVRKFTFNLYFHCYMYIVDVNKDLIFFSAFLDLQRIRDDEATTPRSSFSLMLWQMLRLLHRKQELKLQTLAKQRRSSKALEFFRKYPKTPIFDHSNYRLFERIPAVTGTLNNRGLTVYNCKFPISSFSILVKISWKSEQKYQSYRCKICIKMLMKTFFITGAWSYDFWVILGQGRRDTCFKMSKGRIFQDL